MRAVADRDKGCIWFDFEESFRRNAKNFRLKEFFEIQIIFGTSALRNNFDLNNVGKKSHF